MDKYVPASNTRPENVPFYNDSEFKKIIIREFLLDRYQVDENEDKVKILEQIALKS